MTGARTTGQDNMGDPIGPKTKKYLSGYLGSPNQSNF